MKKTKKLLSLLTAVTITASAFASLVIPASAADDGAVLYSQDYETAGAVADWTTSTTTRYTPQLLIDATEGINNYLTVDQTQRSNNGATVSSPEINVNASRFAVEFDIKLGSSADTFASFDIQNSAGTPFFHLEQTAKNGTTWRINSNADYDLLMPKAGNVRKGTNEDIESLGWYHFVIQYADDTMYVTAKDRAEDTYVKIGAKEVNQMLVPPAANGGGVKKMVFNTGKTTADFAIDNIIVRNLNEDEVVEAKYYNLTINTSRYAKMTYTRSDDEEEKTIFSNASGKIEIPLIPEDTEITYSLSKTGYVAASSASVTMNDNKTIDAPLIPNDDIKDYLYYESDFGNDAGVISGREADVALGDIELSDITEITFDLNIPVEEKTHVTVAFFNDDSKGMTNKNDVFGIQCSANGVFAFSDYNGKSDNTIQGGWIQYQALGAYERGVKIADSYVGNTPVKMVVDKNQKTVTATFGDNAPQVVQFTKDASVIKYLKLAKHDTVSNVTIDNLIVKEPNPNYVLVTGDTEFAKIAGKTVTKQFTSTPAIYIPDELFTWTATDAATGAEIAGVSIDNNGLLSVEDTVAVPATVKIEAVSQTTATKKGELEVNIRDFANLIPTVEYPKVINVGESAKLKVTQIVDQYGDDVTEYFSPTWSIDDVPSLDTDVTFDTTDKTGDAVAISVIKENGILQSISTQNVTISGNETTVAAEGGSTVMLWDSLEGMKPLALPQIAPEATIGEDVIAAVGAKSGTIKANNVGDVTVKLTLREGQEPEEYRIDIGNYYKVLDYSEVADNQVDISDLTEDESITGYQVTVADADGSKIAQEVVPAADSKVTVPAAESGTPAKVEVAPVYTTTAESELLIPAETYNITLKTNTAGRADLYVNDQIIVNNINQDSQNFTVKGAFPATTYDFGDIKIAEGYAQFNYRDNQSGNKPIDEVVIVKAPSIVKRATRVYVIGDSLVATYHDHEGVEESKKNLVRQGWGEALKDYIKDAEVTNLGNSGATSDGMLGVAFTQVRASGQAGDILVLEGGYNDKSVPLMKDSIKQMVIEAEKKGITVFVVPPNASTHSENEYKGNVKSHAGVKDAVNELKSAGYHPILIDLSTNSSKFFERNYGAYATVSTDETKWNNIRDTYNNSADTLHSTVNAANAWAAVVAKGIYDNEPTRKYVDTDYSFTITDANDSNHQVVVSALTVN